MTYTMVKKTPFKFPTERYLNVVKRGYKDCNLDKKYLKKALMPSCEIGRHKGLKSRGIEVKVSP